MTVTGDIILRTLKQAGYKFTGKRREIVQLFVDNPNAYMTARDIMSAVMKRYPAISFDTIYRTLQILEENGSIERAEFHEDAVRYRLTCQSGQHHHHVICLRCGKTKVLDTCPMAHVPVNVDGFEVVEHRFELYGYCSGCYPS